MKMINVVIGLCLILIVILMISFSVYKRVQRDSNNITVKGLSLEHSRYEIEDIDEDVYLAINMIVDSGEKGGVSGSSINYDIKFPKQEDFEYPINNWGCFLLAINYIHCIVTNSSTPDFKLLSEQLVANRSVIGNDCTIYDRVKSYILIGKDYNNNTIWPSDIYIAKFYSNKYNNDNHFTVMRKVNDLEWICLYDPSRNNYRYELKEMFNFSRVMSEYRNRRIK